MSSQFGYDPTKVAGSGETIYGTAGAAIANRDICCVAADGLYYPADADLAVWMPSFGIAMSTMATGQTGQFLVKGFIGLATWTWTPGSELYVSATAGQMSHTAGAIRQQVGVAFTATQVFIHPQGLDSETGCALLEGHTAYVGFDNCRAAAYSNYWVCDGAADDVQIALAITYALGIGGGTVFLEEGTYDITATITFAGGDLQIIGDGRAATILSLGFNGHLMLIASQNNFTIRDLSMVGNKATYATDFWNGVYPQTVDNLLVENCDFYDFAGKGIFARAVTDSVFEACRFYSNGQDGLYLEDLALGAASERVSVNSCFAYSNGRKGFNNGEIKDVSFIGCMSYSNTEDGWNIEGSSDNSYQLERVTLTDCNAFNNTQTGFRIQLECFSIELNSCEAYGNTQHGVYLRGEDTYPAKDLKIIGGSYHDNTLNGILIAYGMENVLISNVAIFNNDQGDTGFDGISLSNDTNIQNVIITDIHVYDDQGAPTQTVGVDLGTNDLSGQNFRVFNITGTGNTTALFRGTGAILATKTFPFIAGGDVEGTAIWASFVSATASAKGWSVTGAADWAVALNQLPLELQQVVRIKIWAVALGAPIAAGGQMHLEIVMNAGADDLAFNTEPVALANFDSETTDYVNADVVHWVVDSGDDADVGSMVGGMSLEVKVIYETGADPDGATNAVFRTVEVEYV